MVTTSAACTLKAAQVSAAARRLFVDEDAFTRGCPSLDITRDQLCREAEVAEETVTNCEFQGRPPVMFWIACWVSRLARVRYC